MISFSRHARRRMQLYGIEEVDVEIVIKTWSAETGPREGRHSIVGVSPSAQSRFPLKVVFSMKGRHFEVITVYPLKKGAKQ